MDGNNVFPTQYTLSLPKSTCKHLAHLYATVDCRRGGSWRLIRVKQRKWQIHFLWIIFSRYFFPRGFYRWGEVYPSPSFWAGRATPPSQRIPCHRHHRRPGFWGITSSNHPLVNDNLLPPPLSNDRSCLTTETRSDRIFRSDPRSDRNFLIFW